MTMMKEGNLSHQVLSAATVMLYQLQHYEKYSVLIYMF